MSTTLRFEILIFPCSGGTDDYHLRERLFQIPIEFADCANGSGTRMQEKFYSGNKTRNGKLPACLRYNVWEREAAPVRGQQRGSRGSAPPLRGRGGSVPSSTPTICTGDGR
ncbi:hypothetical protein C8R41DRAFT_867386 [Lentinula lateritia]|uniref:Uncharacterized protein n=1 Tax=Lentinula lateritia TaxID=40482 RepID=A0ABQ8VFC6_9AGAR|nr:hypothetical protein C8R41DRAFT_867386 [Lentinula lateritia]